MLDKLSNLVFEKAYAVTAKDFTNFFNPKPATGTVDAEKTANTIITKVVTWLLTIAAVLAFFYLILYGIKYITAGGDAAKATEARTGIINSIIGIAVISLAFFIMRFAMSVGTLVTK